MFTRPRSQAASRPGRFTPRRPAPMQAQAQQGADKTMELYMVANQVRAQPAFRKSKENSSYFSKAGSGLKSFNALDKDEINNLMLRNGNFNNWAKDFSKFLAPKGVLHLLDSKRKRTVLTADKYDKLCRRTHARVNDYNKKVQFQMMSSQNAAQTRNFSSENSQEVHEFEDMRTQRASQRAPQRAQEPFPNLSVFSPVSGESSRRNYSENVSPEQRNTARDASTSRENDFQSQNHPSAPLNELSHDHLRTPRPDPSASSMHTDHESRSEDAQMDGHLPRRSPTAFRRGPSAPPTGSPLPVRTSGIHHFTRRPSAAPMTLGQLKELLITMPKWVDDHMTQHDNVANSEDAHPVYQTPHGIRPVGSMFGNKKLNKTRTELIQRDRARLEENNQDNSVVYFVAFDEEDDFNCLPEDTADTEARIFVWELLKRVLGKGRALSFDEFYTHDVLALWMYAWEALYNGTPQVDRAQRQEVLEPEFRQGESVLDYYSRLEKKYKEVNHDSPWPIPLQEFNSAILYSLSDNEIFGKRADELIEEGCEFDEAKDILLRKERNRNEKQAVKTLTAKKSKKQLANVAREEAVTKSSEFDESEAFAKAFEAFKLYFANTHSANTKSNSNGGQGGGKKDYECYLHKKFGACPSGSNCPFTHDPSKGGVGDTKLPKKNLAGEEAKCPECGQRHWLRDCPSARGQAYRIKDDAGKDKRRKALATQALSARHSTDESSDDGDDYANIVQLFADSRVKAYGARTNQVHQTYADSGATSAIFLLRSVFIEYHQLREDIKIQIADGEVMTATHGGTAQIWIRGKPLLIEHALHVPTAGANLLGIGRLTSHKYKADVLPAEDDDLRHAKLFSKSLHRNRRG